MTRTAWLGYRCPPAGFQAAVSRESAGFAGRACSPRASPGMAGSVLLRERSSAGLDTPLPCRPELSRGLRSCWAQPLLPSGRLSPSGLSRVQAAGKGWH